MARAAAAISCRPRPCSRQGQARSTPGVSTKYGSRPPATRKQILPCSNCPANQLQVRTPSVVARVRPNEDIITAVEAIARAHHIPDAIIRGSLGSLIGARFADGTNVPDDATEVLVRAGRDRGGHRQIDLLSIDMRGRVHQGRLERGENPVCITFDLVLTRTG